jgi:alpha-1,3-mannosyl-glycoprotein beta-1,2-N-acetylglucosaminyltransferase
LKDELKILQKNDESKYFFYIDKPKKKNIFIPSEPPKKVDIEKENNKINNAQENNLKKNEEKYIDIDDVVIEDLRANNNFNNEKEKIKGKLIVEDDDNLVIPILIFSYQRADYLERCLHKLFQYLPKKGFKIFVSQDGHNEQVNQKIESYSDRLTHLIHERNVIIPEEYKKYNPSYMAIAQHYKYGLTQVFQNELFNNVIVLEEDIEISPDFFEYFRSLSKLLDIDDTLLCISSWNDNGMKQFVKDPSK